MSTLLFLRDVATRPLEMGAILPSSAHLARAMVRAADIQPGHVVLELGAGSGAFTREIVGQHPDNPLILVEPGPALAQSLQSSFPGAMVLPVGAEALAEPSIRSALPRVDRVVSGLPWALWGRERQARLLDAVVPLLAPDAVLVTFHYVHSRMLGAVAPLRGLFASRFQDIDHTTPVWANVPPAYVHRAKRPFPHPSPHTRLSQAGHTAHPGL